MSTLTLFGCSNNDSSKPISPNENGGMEANEDEDSVIIEDDTKLETLFEYVTDNLVFEYDTSVALSGQNQHFTQTFTPLAWYVDEESEAETFGYAMSPNDYYMFKYYLSEDEKSVYPSIFEYSGYNTLDKVESIYGPFTLAHPYMLEATMETLSYVKTAPNTYLLTDTNTISVFQYMTTVGSSITNYINSTTIQIIDEEQHIFDCIIDLGQYGEIVSRYTPLQETKIDFVNDLLISGELVGVDYYPEVKKFFDITANNNFTMKGILSETVSVPKYNISCTNDYFFLEYAEQYSADYPSFGYAFIEKNTPVDVISIDPTTNQKITTTYSLDYDACFEFQEDENGDLYFDKFVGPIENEGIQYVQVDSLPQVGEEGILYIISENGEENVYEWKDQGNGEMGYSFYSSWYDTVGDFYLNLSTATFYLSSSGLCDYGYQLFEKTYIDNDDNYEYYSHNSDVLSALANGMFGWGFSKSTTWMDNIQQAHLTVNLNTNNEVESADIGLSVLHSGRTEYIYYTLSDFGSTSVSEVEQLLSQLGGNN